MASRFLLLFLFCCILFLGYTQAQSVSISGTVTDANNNEPLIGATVAVQNSLQGSVTDLDGQYAIGGLAPGTYTLKVSYVGYDSKEISGVEVISREVTNMNITMGVSQTNTLSEVLVLAEARKENISSMLVARKNSAVVSDAISADMIRRSPDKNTSDVLKRVSGITIQENKFVVVRGMNDRYNSAMLNGSILPSSEPDRKTFAFDIFPAAVVDNITIAKSVTPDLPGDFSGGLVQINTKEIPDQNFLSVKVGTGLNSITTFKPHYTYPGGKTDWLGLDDGTRAFPAGFPSHNDYIQLSPGSESQIDAAQSLLNNWAYSRESSAPLNSNFELAGGFKAGKASYPSFGGILGVTYNSSLRQNPIERFDYYGLSQPSGDTIYRYNDTAYIRSILTSALADFALRINANNKLVFNNLFSVNSTDQTVLRDGYSQSQGAFVKANAFYFTSNKIYNGQLGGEHFLPGIKLRIRWQGYYTSLQRDEPDYRRNLYYRYDDYSPYFCVLSSSPSTNVGAGIHYYGEITDQTTGANIDLSESFKLFKQTQTVRFGGTMYHNERNRDVRVMSNIIADAGSFDQNLYYASQDTIFAPEHYNSQTGFLLYEDRTPTNHYDGSIDNAAGYVMLDNKFTNKVRMVWGIRYENYHSILNTFDQSGDAIQLDTTYKDFLPSVNLILSVLKDANLRFSYSQTVARPSYRELANAPFYDFLNNITYFGNINLVETHISNYEMRWEQYFGNAQYYSASFFYKEFENPIEQNLFLPGSDSRSVQFVNVPNATNIGLELEGRKNFDFLGNGWENLYAYANVAYIKSKVSVSGATSDTSTNRPLEGQSPLVFNASLQYTEPKTHLGISLLFNAIGYRLNLVGSVSDPAVWQKTHPTMDLKVSKTFLKNGLVEFTWNDIIHGDDIFYQDLNETGTYESAQPQNYAKGDRVVEQRHYGFNLSLAVSYRF